MNPDIFLTYYQSPFKNYCGDFLTYEMLPVLQIDSKDDSRKLRIMLEMVGFMLEFPNDNSYLLLEEDLKLSEWEKFVCYGKFLAIKNPNLKRKGVFNPAFIGKNKHDDFFPTVNISTDEEIIFNINFIKTLKKTKNGNLIYTVEILSNKKFNKRQIENIYSESINKNAYSSLENHKCNKVNHELYKYKYEFTGTMYEGIEDGISTFLSQLINILNFLNGEKQLV